MFLTGTVPIYALAWVILWIVGTILEFAVFVATAVASGDSLPRKQFPVSLAMPAFALFCLGMLFSIKCVEYLIEFLCFLTSEDPEETAIDGYEKLALRRRPRARRGY
jgi:Sec-independent protein secretion pathway component TatC